MHNHRNMLAQQRNLEEEADRLLWNSASPPGEMEYPFHSEGWLRRVGRCDHRSELPVLKDVDEAQGADLLDHLLEQVSLPLRYQRTLHLMRQGALAPQLAEALGVSERTVRRWRQEVLTLLRRRARCGLLDRDSIDAARREQVSQGHVQEEKHCEPGREACRLNGLCRYRWYLYFEAE